MAAGRSIVARDDTLLGVCFALGEDFGFNPVYLRVLFALLLFWSELAAVGAYAGLGMIVAFTRWLVPEADAAAEDGHLEKREEPSEALALAA
jgi:phage shock protein C